MRVALITGAARGIGRAIAEDLAKDHAIAFTYFQGTAAAQDLCNAHPEALAIQADLSQPEIAQDVIAKVIAQFGRIDVLVNNAGDISETPHDAFDAQAHARLYATNSIAPMALLSAALPHFSEGASVVNIASMNADTPPATAGAYAGSKAALVAQTKSAAKALGARGIRVNAISPGLVERSEKPRPKEIVDLFLREMALPRVGAPEDIAPVVRFLATEASRYITGECITVSGGFRL